MVVSRPHETKTLALRPNENVNCVILVFCIAPQVSILSNKSTLGINNVIFNYIFTVCYC